MLTGISAVEPTRRRRYVRVQRGSMIEFVSAGCPTLGHPFSSALSTAPWQASLSCRFRKPSTTFIVCMLLFCAILPIPVFSHPSNSEPKISLPSATIPRRRSKRLPTSSFPEQSLSNFPLVARLIPVRPRLPDPPLRPREELFLSLSKSPFPHSLAPNRASLEICHQYSRVRSSFSRYSTTTAAPEREPTRSTPTPFLLSGSYREDPSPVRGTRFIPLLGRARIALLQPLTHLARRYIHSVLYL